jgi:TRAP-type transport system periplasmic protein
MSASRSLLRASRFLLAAVLAAALAGRASADPKVIRLGHVGYPGSLFAITSDEYAKRVNEALKGKYEVRVFHSSQLGSD